MVIHYYAIYDRKARAFGELLSFASGEKEAARRWFRDIVLNEDPKNYLAKYPEDFDLYYIGFFDKSQGEFVSEVTDAETGIASDVREFVMNAAVFFLEKEEVVEE